MSSQKKILAAVIILVIVAILFYYQAQKASVKFLIDSMNKITFGSDAEKANYIYSKLGIDEGGYSFDPNDSGGETYAGIARNFHPQWAGWKVIDNIKLQRNLKHNEHLLELDNLHFQFFMDEYYNKYQTNKIKNTGMQYLYLDTIWMSHWQQAADSIRSVFNISTKPIWELDGIKYFNDENLSQALANELIERRISFVENLVHRSPKDKKFLTGWTNRFKELLTDVTNLI